MAPMVSMLWGLAGGAVVEALEVTAAIRRNKGRWPWRRKTFWPSLVAVVLRLGVCALVTGAMSDQLAGTWPAFSLGVGAPLLVARLAERVPQVSAAPQDQDNNI